MTGQRFTDPGNAGIDRGRRMRPRHKGNPLASESDKMLRQEVSRSHVVQAHEIEITSLRKRSEVPVNQHDGDPRLTEPLGNFPVRLLAPWNQFKWGKENSSDLPLGKLFTNLSCLIEAETGILTRMLRTTPKESKILGACEARQFATDPLKNLRPPKSGDQEPQMTTRLTAVARGPNKTSGSLPSLYQPPRLKVVQRPDDGGPGHSVLPDQLRLAGKPDSRSEPTGTDSLLEFTTDPPMFGVTFRHGYAGNLYRTGRQPVSTSL